MGYKIETQRREEIYNVPDGWYVFEIGYLGEWERVPSHETLSVRKLLHYIKNGGDYRNRMGNDNACLDIVWN